MNRSSLALLLGTALLSSAFAAGKTEGTSSPASSAPASAPYTIEVAGSTSVTPLMELLAAGYAKIRSNVKININGTGSSDGIKAAAAGTSELGMSSRELSPAEKGTGLTELTIAIDGIAVIVNNSNPVANLTLDQIRDIYTGAVTDWSQVSGGAKSGRIAVVSREPGSGTRGAFEEIVKFQDKLLSGATEFDGTGAIKAEISRNADAVGYISLGSADNTVKLLQVEGITASTANVVNGSYKIARPFIVLSSRQTIHDETQQFLNWIMTADGQNIVKSSWIPVK
ncbi:MAG: phosphate ABC transporter substrate-binding protein [Treponema sp.]|jgi:phosphate transport system substrate-binding protein|nr:phosphate ABC transporter substrate-binding protein [Treponema sp.]